MGLKFFLDDIREPPSAEWVWFDSAHSMIEALSALNKEVEIISLDHDLGEEKIYGTGYDVILWIEAEVYTNLKFNCPIIILHTQNPVGLAKMRAAIVSINKHKFNNKLLQR